MRKNSPRKWLHAILDLLPVILIPVFMVYSHRHKVTVETNVEIEYKYQSNQVNTLNDLQVNNIYFLEEFYPSDYYDETIEDFTGDSVFVILKFDELIFDDIDDYYIDDMYYENYDCRKDNYLYISCSYSGKTFYYTNENCNACVQYETTTCHFNNVILYANDNGLKALKSYCTTNNVLPQYTDFNVIESFAIDTSNNTIGKAFLNDFNETISQYFDFGNAFNFQSIWSWIRINIFNNNVSQIMYSIWCIICYEFLVDLLFIFYSFFMFFIDFAERMIDCFFNKSFGGGR